MKILIMNHYAGSPVYGMEYRPYYLAKEWVKDGHEVTIISASFSHLRIKQPSINEKKYVIETIEGIKYLWINTPKYNGNGIKRIINILTFLMRINSLNNIFKETRYDIVIASSTYPYDNIIARKIVKKWGGKYLYEVHDLWPLSPIELGGYKKWNPLIIITQMVEDMAYKQADAIVSLLPCAFKYMEKHGLANNKYFYIPNGIDINEWNLMMKNKDEKSIKEILLWKQDSILIIYAGAHGISNSLDYLLEAAIKIKDVKFLLVGNGAEKIRLINAVNNMNIKNVKFLDLIPRKYIPSILSLADILYIGLKKQPLFVFGISPNKLIDYMMAGKPIICAIESGNDIVKEANCGITIKAEDSAEIVNAINKLKKLSKDVLSEIGNNGKIYVEKNNDYKILSKKYLNIFKTLKQC